MAPSKVHEISWTSFDNTVDGKNRNAAKFHQGINPVTGEKSWDVPIATKDDVDDAVKSANKAFASWSQTTVDERKALIKKFREVWVQNAEELAELLAIESGKPKQWARFEVDVTVTHFDHNATIKIPEERIEDDEKVITTRFVPVGVVGAICPWNFPLLLAMAKVLPAILTGNCIIVKPSPFTPYTMLKAAELAQQVFPPGVVQALGGDDKLGPWLTEHPGIHKISFTGSIATGKKIMAACAGTLKRVTLELGGNDASIVFPDVDVKKVAPQLVLGAFQNSGQVCVATKRIYIHKDIYEDTLKAMAEFSKTLKVGGKDQPDLGPVQNKMQFDRVKGFFEDTKKNGYKLAVGDYEVPEGQGFYVPLTIVDNPPNGSRIIEEEPFGPIVPTQPWTDLEEVITRANSTNTGLGACVWSADVAQAEKVARRLNAGSVFVNSFEKPVAQAMFSGHRESGVGGEWGSHGLLSYCNAHVTHVYK